MRKIKYLLAVGVMSTALLFGCGSNDEKDSDNSNASAITPEEFIEKVGASETDIKSLEFGVSGEIDASSSTGEETSEIKGSASLDGKANIESNTYQFTVSFNVDGMSMEIECYLVIDEEAPTVYYCMQGMWYKMSLSMDELEGMMSANVDVDTESAATADLSNVLEYLKDTSVEAADGAYTLKGVLDLEKILNDAATEAETDISEYEDIFKELNINVNVSINSEDNTFKSSDIIVNDFSTEYKGETIKINKLKLSIYASNYNGVGEITLPEEAANATDLSGMTSIY